MICCQAAVLSSAQGQVAGMRSWRRRSTSRAADADGRRGHPDGVEVPVCGEQARRSQAIENGREPSITRSRQAEQPRHADQVPGVYGADRPSPP